MCLFPRHARGFFWVEFMRVFYGLGSIDHLPEMVRRVCNTLGNGAHGTAVDLILETMAQETRLGAFKDPTPYGAGRGVAQFDLIAFKDVQERTSPGDVDAIKAEFAIDIKKTRHDQLDYSPLLSIIFCRLFYKLVKAPIPAELQDRAHYWKRYYNTTAGKGTASEYVHNARLCERFNDAG